VRRFVRRLCAEDPRHEMPAPDAFVLTVLDAVVIVLTWIEYRRLKGGR
jgi:hypothetical protein